MAQIMKYHEHPTTRTVAIPGYTTETYTISIPNITGTTNYDWSNMSNTYTTSGTSVTTNAVATLMYHCGISVKMDYKLSANGGSSAYSFDVASALISYFGYDAGIAYCNRNYYSYTEWIDLLKTEIRANRPVYYSGHGSGGGHAFVCDGYDTDNLFHFNWGWSGSSDGYFEISALNPSSLGIGGGAGGYNQSQAIITGIQPATGNGNPAIMLGLSTVSANTSGNLISMTAENLANIGIVTITNVYLGVLLCNQDNSYRSHQTSEQNIKLDPRYYYPTRSLIKNYSLPSGLPAGTYKLYPAYSASSGIPTIIPGKNGNRYITVIVNANGSFTLSNASVIPELSLVSLKPVGNLYQDATGSFEAEITNSGTADYNSNMSLRLGTQTVATEPVVIPAGTTKTVGFSGTVSLSSGNYSLSVLYDPNNLPESTPSTQLGNAVSSVEVRPTPGTPKLSLVSASFQNGNNAVPQNAPNLTVTIKNEDGLFNERICVFIFPASGGNSIGSFGATHVMIEKGETKSILFNNPIDFLEAGTRYRARVDYYDGRWIPLENSSTFTVAAPILPSSDASLKSLVVKDAQTQTPLSLSPDFTPSTTSYTAVASPETSMISIIGEATHAMATFTNIENQTLDTGGDIFEIEVTAEDGTTKKTYTIEVTITKATENTRLVVKDESTDMPLYPNPFTDEFHLKGVEGYTLRIFNLDGILIHIQEVMNSDETIRSKHLKAGVYLFRLDNKNGKAKTIQGIKK
jgi:hypothetical protein